MTAPIAIRLAIRTWAARPLRPVLCSIAIGVAVALIICIGVAMDSLAATLSTVIGQNLGVAEIHVRPSEVGNDSRLPKAVLDKLLSLPETDFADGRLWGLATINNDPVLRSIVGVDNSLAPGSTTTTMDEKLRPKIFKEGRPLSSDPAKAVHELLIDSTLQDAVNAAAENDEKKKIHLGDTVKVTIDTHGKGEVPAHELTIVGIVKRPSLEVLAAPTVYVDYNILATDMNARGEYRVFDVKLKDSAGITDYDQYAKDLQKKLDPFFPDKLDIRAGTTNKAKLGDLSENMNIMLLVLSTLAALCAALIIGSTLSVGVQERVRQFGQLRCLGASPGQLASFLLGDALVMMAIGETLGLILGLSLSWWAIHAFPKYFTEYRASIGSLSMAGLCGMLATLFGAAIPIWQVTRVTPMAAVTSTAKPPRNSRLFLAAAIGVLCLALQIALWNVPTSREFRFYSYIFPGIPLVFAGWTLLAPAILIVLEKVASNLFGRLLGVQPSLLRSSWSRTPWRASAMVAALMVGVTLFTSVRARGQSILASWTVPDRVPDLMALRTAGLGPADLKALRDKHPEFTSITTFDYFAVTMKDKVFQLGSLFSRGNTTFVMTDPQDFSKLVDLEFLQGDAPTALAELKQGGHLLVPKEFYNVKHLGRGDKVTLYIDKNKPVEFTVSAVVNSTGIDLLQNFFDLRSAFDEKASSSVLGTIEDARKLFGRGEPTMMIANYDHTKVPDSQQFVKTLQDQDRLICFSSAELKNSLVSLIGRIIDGLTIIGIGALCVASLGVANMVIASIHARRFEFGVLRAIGAGRFQLVRLVLAEVTLIALVAGTLGALAGLHYAYMGGRMEFLLMGYPNEFVSANATQRIVMILVTILLAIGLTTLLAWLASVVPAIRGARAAQRAVLASGRA